ncbi:MAG TPA: S9 family peptidase [Caulobacteraceae bacterium]|jgi:dipeptidyl aminopeptidase/acylaminoacyl peptidase|nr:S9 family peptidase [Caulobacteraceae bacterium]
MIALLAAAVLQIASAPPVRQYHDLALAPAGDRIADVESTETGEEAERPHAALVIRSAHDGTILRTIDPCATCAYAAPAWSPDGASLAFLATSDNGFAVSLFVVDRAEPRVVAALTGVAGQPRWSPDGARIAILATPNAHKKIGATQAGAPLVGEIGEVNDEQRIAVVSRTGGAPRYVSPADTFVYEYDWTPNGAGFIATAAKGNGDNNWWVARLETFDAETGAEKVLAAPKFQINYPRVSPDGKTVGLIGGLMSDFGSVGGDLYTIPLDGGDLMDRTPGFKGTFTSVDWRGHDLIATALIGDRNAIIAVDPAKRSAHVLWSGPVLFAAADFNGEVQLTADGAIAATVIQDFAHPPAINVGKIAAPRPITHDNDGLKPDLAMRSVSWTSEGHDVQGWLLTPLQLDPGRAYPMIVNVHGGPSAASRPRYASHGTLHDLVAHGDFVFLPNPRGSYGQGEAFTAANRRDFGGGDWRDVMAGVDAVEKIAPVDDRRLGLYGGSYGGFMTMWGVTQSQRFHAAVAGAGIANWISYYGQNGIDEWMIPFFGASAYDDPAIYNAESPINFIKNAKTPTFIFVGERDVEVPAPQSLEFWHALHAEGVPTSLIIYPGEGHGVRRPDHVQDLNRRIIAWFDKYLGAGA